MSIVIALLGKPENVWATINGLDFQRLYVPLTTEQSAGATSMGQADQSVGGPELHRASGQDQQAMGEGKTQEVQGSKDAEGRHPTRLSMAWQQEREAGQAGEHGEDEGAEGGACGKGPHQAHRKAVKEEGEKPSTKAAKNQTYDGKRCAAQHPAGEGAGEIEAQLCEAGKVAGQPKGPQRPKEMAGKAHQESAGPSQGAQQQQLQGTKEDAQGTEQQQQLKSLERKGTQGEQQQQQLKTLERKERGDKAPLEKGAKPKPKKQGKKKSGTNNGNERDPIKSEAMGKAAEAGDCDEDTVERDTMSEMRIAGLLPRPPEAPQTPVVGSSANAASSTDCVQFAGCEDSGAKELRALASKEMAMEDSDESCENAQNVSTYWEDMMKETEDLNRWAKQMGIM